MNKYERWQQIEELVNQRGFLTVKELSQLSHTSEITIRRDLESLNSQMRVRKTHGGAASLRVGASGVVDEETNGAPHADQSVFERIDVLVTADMSPKLANLIEKSIRKRKIPLIAESQPLPGTETYVAVDNYQAGFDLGRWAGQYAQEHCDGQAHVLDLAYHRPNTLLRSQGFLAGLREVIPAAELILSINTQSRFDMAYQLTRDALTVHPKINLIFAMNDISALGAYQACKDLGIDPDRLIILTFGVEGAKMLDLIVQGGWIKAGVCMFPEIVGTICVEAAIAAYNHQALPAELVTPYCIVTPDTLLDIYQKTQVGWKLDWRKIPCQYQLPLPVNLEKPDTLRPLPRRMGFIYTFIEHDWYKTVNETMREYTSRLGIELEALDFEQTIKDELNLRRTEIARLAANEVQLGDTIFIDSGPISGELAERLKNHKNITVITNSMPVLEVLNESQTDITLISTGGALRRSSQAFVGPNAESNLKEFRIDKLFLMVSGVSINFGLSHTHISEVTIKQLMIHAAREVILLADHACFQEEALIQVAPVTAIHKLITDNALPASIRLELGTFGISVILASM
jgi:DeoR/GlpR family transcriptional regulator of sugar metabolism/ABC-type sugar transport system substrate-binding protein